MTELANPDSSELMELFNSLPDNAIVAAVFDQLKPLHVSPYKTGSGFYVDDGDESGHPWRPLHDADDCSRVEDSLLNAGFLYECRVDPTDEQNDNSGSLVLRRTTGQTTVDAGAGFSVTTRYGSTEQRLRLIMVMALTAVEIWERLMRGRGHTIPPNDQLSKVMEAIHDAHKAYADDCCHFDIDNIFTAAGLPIPDRKVGDKFEMAKNCMRFIDVKCSGGTWKSYAEIEAENANLRKVNESLTERIHAQSELLSRRAERPDDNPLSEVHKWSQEQLAEAARKAAKTTIPGAGPSSGIRPLPPLKEKNQ